jgi:hypothetical protein
LLIVPDEALPVHEQFDSFQALRSRLADLVSANQNVAAYVFAGLHLSLGRTEAEPFLYYVADPTGRYVPLFAPEPSLVISEDGFIGVHDEDLEGEMVQTARPEEGAAEESSGADGEEDDFFGDDFFSADED